MNFIKNILLGASIATLFSCEDVISVEVDEGIEQLAVDAFLNNKNESQKVILLSTKQFFSSSKQEVYKADSVYVIDNLNNKYIFEDLDGDGTYEWDDTVLVHVGRTYNLTIKKGADLYTAISKSKPVPEIDSINWEYSPAGFGAENGGYITQMVARDLAGQEDFYRIRWAKNGVFTEGSSSINLSVDGSFSSNAAGSADGGLFVPPVAVFPAIDYEDSLGLGDIFTYELMSIEEATYDFWTSVLNQKVDGALGALFATPTSNVESNIVGNSKAVSKTAVGWFSVSMVDAHSQLISDKEGEALVY